MSDDYGNSIPLKLNRSVPFVDTIFRIIEGVGSELEAMQILSEAETVTEVQLLSTKQPPPSKQIPVEDYEAFVEPRMNKFLSQTNLVLGSTEYSDLHIVIANNYSYAWTHREWGYMLAKWANGIRWLGSEEWKYLDFYGGINDRVVENYDAWCATVLRVIEMKSNLTT